MSDVVWLGWYSSIRWIGRERVLVMQHAFENGYAVCGTVRQSDGRPVAPAPWAPPCRSCQRSLETRKLRAARRREQQQTAFREVGG